MNSISTAESPGMNAYRSAFTSWDTRSSVRAKPVRDAEQEAGKLFYPPELVPVLNHPEVAALGSSARDQVLVLSLYHYLLFTVQLEQLVVLPVTARIAAGKSGLELPMEMRADSFKITTDEAYHAQFSFGYIRATEARTSVRAPSKFSIALLDRLKRLAPADPSLLPAVELLRAIVSETLISSMLNDIPHDSRLHPSVRGIVLDHAEDERRHHAYFHSFLEHFWHALNRRERADLIQLVPSLIVAFLRPDERAAQASLAAIGLEAHAANLVSESMDERSIQQRIATAAAPLVRYFDRLGALKSNQAKDAFGRAGLL